MKTPNSKIPKDQMRSNFCNYIFYDILVSPFQTDPVTEVLLIQCHEV